MAKPRLLLMAPSSISGNGLYSLAALATYAEEFSEVRILDRRSEFLSDVLGTFRPHTVGITSYTPIHNDAVRMMEEVKRLRPEALRILGGVHITSAPWSLDPVFDAGVLGDGEGPLRDIMAAGKKEDLEGIPGICTRHDGEIRITGARNTDLATLPVPKMDVYAPGSCANGIAGILTSRGCPFKCPFCYTKNMRPQMKEFPVEWVGEHFQYVIKNLKASYVMLWDDCICLRISRISEIADELERRRLPRVKMSVNVTGSAMTEELADALRDLGVVSWNTGFESGSPRMLAKVKPGATQESHKELVAMAAQRKTELHGSFILGMPGEKSEDMEMSLGLMRFLCDEKAAGRHRGGFWWFTATPFPGTAWWDIALSRGKVSGTMDWSRLNFANRKEHLLMDESVKESEWERITAEADRIITRNNSMFPGFSLPVSGPVQCEK